MSQEKIHTCPVCKKPYEIPLDSIPDWQSPVFRAQIEQMRHSHFHPPQVVDPPHNKILDKPSPAEIG